MKIKQLTIPFLVVFLASCSGSPDQISESRLKEVMQQGMEEQFSNFKGSLEFSDPECQPIEREGYYHCSMLVEGTGFGDVEIKKRNTYRFKKANDEWFLDSNLRQAVDSVDLLEE